LNSKGEWTVGDTLDTNGMNNKEYKKKYQQQLQTVRRIWLDEYQKPRKGDTADIEQTVQALIQSLEEKETRLQEKEKEAQESKREARVFRQKLEQKEREEAEKEQEIRRHRHQLQEKDREHQVVLQESQEALWQKVIVIIEKARELQEKDRELQEKDREHQVVLQEKDRELQEKDRELRESQDHWSINKDEVTLTKEELGRGSYAVVTVGIFRGLRVAVKSLHNIIISDYNLGIFSREMSIASRVRHPNLVQFIGATKVGNPLILTELMSTSLNRELRRNRLSNQQILSIAQDVALGLNYLHLFKPQPIIHQR
uniref:Protein kinase domain-containing protein n=1 Tax=Amphimedon queenslandica TaxID=400682 RepID=A0A1X7SLW2_AMPQE